MKQKHVFLLFILPLLAAQCKKEEPTKKLITVGGYAYDLATKDSLADVKIRLRRDDITSAGGGSALRDYETLLDSTTTDANGFFSFTFLAEEKRYCYEPIKQGYWYHPSMTITYFGQSDAGSIDQVNLYPLTYLMVHIKNEAPAQATDSIWYDGPTDKSSKYIESFYSPGIYSHDFGLTGNQVDTSFIVTIKYNEAPLQYWDVTENGITTRSIAYVGCNPHDTCLVEIKY